MSRQNPAERGFATRHHQPVSSIQHRRQDGDLQPAPTSPRGGEFNKFLAKIDIQVPDDLDVRLICDNYGTDKHPRR